MIKFDVINRFSRTARFTAEIDCDENALDSVKLGLAVKWAMGNRAVLRGVNLCRADLYGVDLSEANLSGANLSGANLSEADLSKADLYGVDLRGADLSRANLIEANLDFATWPLCCGSLSVKIDERLARQLLYHVAAIAGDFVKFTPEQIDFANGFHRMGEVPKLEDVR